MAAKKPVVIITGVSSGIGLASAGLFARQGWLVVGTVRRRPYPTELSTLAIDIQMAEMTKPGDLRRVVRKTLATYGRIDAVVANAGYGLAGELETLGYDKIAAQLEVNVVAVAELCRLVLPAMMHQQRGVIIGLSSLSGRIGVPGYSAYSASKFALEGLFESLWYELSGYGIKLRLIEPSIVRSPFWVKVQRLRRPKPIVPYISLGAVSGRLGLTAEVVASRIYRAATSRSDKLHYPLGLTALAGLAKRVLPDRWFRWIVLRFYGRLDLEKPHL